MTTPARREAAAKAIEARGVAKGARMLQHMGVDFVTRYLDGVARLAAATRAGTVAS